MLGRDARGLLAVALATALLSTTLLGGRARAEDAVGEPAKPSKPPAAPPAGLPGARAKIAHPYLDGLVGTWDLTMKIAGKPDQKGRARWWKALDDSALVEELASGEGDDAFFGLGILYAGADGKSVKRWWFDSMGEGDVWHTAGTLTDDGWVLRDEQSEHVMKKTAGGHAYTMKMTGMVAVEVAYTKAASDVPPSMVEKSRTTKAPLVLGAVGDYAVKGEFLAAGKKMAFEGKASLRLGVGGAHLVMDYDATGSGVRVLGMGVLAVAPGGGSLSEWWFSNFADAPIASTGPLTETTWKAKAATSPHGAMDLTWEKVADGMKSTITFADGSSMTESYVRKP